MRAPGRSRSVVHNYCHRKGHVLADCWSLQKKSDALVHTVEESDLIGSPGSQRAPVIRPDNTYQPFIFEGLVSMTEDGIPVQIRLLRDTGATQSLMVQNVLPFTDQSSEGASVLVQGVELGIVKVPLHRVFLKSNLVSGFVTVGASPTLPISGVGFILGNDLAGSKVDLQPELQVVDDPEELEPQELSAAETAAVFPPCVVTRAAAQRARDGKEEVKEPNDFSSKDNSSLCSVDTTKSVSDINAGKNGKEIPEATVSS